MNPALLMAVALGGGLGAMARYGLSGWMQSASGAWFPVGTLLVNIVGSFIIGLVLQLGAGRFLLTPETRLFLTTGFCGGLTTFSTFSWETLRLMEDQQWAAAGANTALNVALCFAATWLGVVAGKLV
ncbi:MAG: fluoride efflux transporter CrcB [Deltaproteobacteria bacterium]|nr:fluoride efflux transporter CrcB [Deltaproteobacteria bacterium]